MPSAPSWAESSFTGTHWSSPQAELRADFQPHRPLGTCPAMDSQARTSVDGHRGGTEDIPKHGHPRTLPAGSREDEHFPLVAGKTLSTGQSGVTGADRQNAPTAGLSGPALPSHLDPRSAMPQSQHRPCLVTATATPGETNGASEHQGSVRLRDTELLPTLRLLENV